MLPTPNIKNEKIKEHLKENYNLNVESISFLPIGADFNTIVYRIKTNHRGNYFLKLRKQDFFEYSVKVPNYLYEHEFKQVIPPIATLTGNLFTKIDNFNVILYPYIEGLNGTETKLSSKSWVEFGSAMKKLHITKYPENVVKNVKHETFSAEWCEIVNSFLKLIEEKEFKEPIAYKMALFLKSKKEEILKIVNKTKELANKLQNTKLENTLCHADIHGWNLLLDKKENLYIVDWDTLIFAPKERDLMFIGAGINKSGYSAKEENSMFFQGYGEVDINKDVICYYRYERIIRDIGEYCEYMFSSDVGDNRELYFEYLKSNFLTGGTIEMAYLIDK